MNVSAFYYLPNLFAACLTAMAAYYLWPSRSIRGANTLLLILGASSFWALCEAFLYFDNSISAKIRITQLQYLGITVIPPNFLIFILRYVGWDRWLNRRAVIALNSISVIMLILAWTNGLHGWVWSEMVRDESGPFTMLALTHGPAFWLFIAFSYFIVFVVLAIIARMYFVSPLVIRRQYRLLFAAFSVPWVASMVYINHLLPVPNLDPTPSSFCLMALLIGYSYIRHRMYDVMPVARDIVFSSLPDGIMVIDNHNRLAFMNSAAEKIVGMSNDEAVGTDITGILNQDIAPEQTDADTVSDEMTIFIEGDEKTFDLQSSRLFTAQKEYLGRLIVYRDITRRKKLENELRDMAMVDPLTGAYNRRHFVAKGVEEVERSRRYHNDLSVLMMDIDHFKRINDQYGHDVGDLVLKEMTQVCLCSVRNVDTLGRLGGEEFGVIMPQIGMAQAITAAKRICQTVREMTVDAAGQCVELTVSIGVATFNRSDNRIESILKSADRALYHAKNSGRNRVCSTDDLP